MSLIPPPPVGIQQRSCDVVCALCELRLVDKMSVEVLMPLASALIKTTLNWKSEVGVLGKVSGKRRGGVAAWKLIIDLFLNASDCPPV